MTRNLKIATLITVCAIGLIIVSIKSPAVAADQNGNDQSHSSHAGGALGDHAIEQIREGKQTFRYDTFGDQAYWGGTLKLHQAIEGANLGGVGPGVSPKTALAVGLKVDMDALPPSLIQQLKAGRVNLNDPATTLALLKLDAVLSDGILQSTGNVAIVGNTVRTVPLDGG